MKGEEGNHRNGVTSTRIFVGGLGHSITADDLLKTFSSLGTVEGVDFIRNNGRSFAYIDFLPSSDKSLPKLFSTYNGCIWKGGKLKLEKAKEHYLVRLRQEWAEDTELASQPSNNNFNAGKSTESSKQLEKVPTSDKMQLRIFFPRLKKVKSLPYSGTGKHKYSFQRIDVPSLPIHFCDCEEHCDPSDTVRGEHVSTPESSGCGMEEKELKLMNSVMNKIFERDYNKVTDCGKQSLTEGDILNQVIEDVPVDENDAEMETDADNLVINMMNGRSSGLDFGETQVMETMLAEYKPRISKFLASDDLTIQKELKAQKRKNTVASDALSTLSKKRTHLLLADESDRDQHVSNKAEMSGSSEAHPEELEGLAESQRTKSEAGGNQSTKSLSWGQKSSWRDLIGETGNSSFNISHILPGTDSKKQEQPNSEGLDATNINDMGLNNAVRHGCMDACSNDMEGLTESQPCEQAIDSCHSTKGLSWLQKSSWRELVGGSGSTSFSISHIFPGISFTKQEAVPNTNDAANCIDQNHQEKVKQVGGESRGDTRKPLGAGEEGLFKDNTTASSGPLMDLEKEEQKSAAVEDEQISHGEKFQIVKDNDDNSKYGIYRELPEKKSQWAPKKSLAVEDGIGEFCSFMRSAVSERQWMKAKTALSGSLKKNSKDK